MGLHLGSIGKIGPKAAAWWGKRASKKAAKKAAAKGAKPAGTLPKLLGALKKEAALSPALHKDVMGALRRMQTKDPSLKQVLEKAHGYAVFPGVGKASAVLGGAFGVGEVFEGGRVVGYAAIVQVTIGVQLGGQTFNELVVFQSRQALDAFKHGKVTFAANASAVIVKAGAAAAASKSGTRVFVHSEGGLGVEAAVGGQKFIFKPALLGRTKTARIPRVGAIAEGQADQQQPDQPT